MVKWTSACNMKRLNEKNLVQQLEKILKKKFFTNMSFTEFSAGYGIADLVLAPDFLFKNSHIKRAPITDYNTLRMLLILNCNKKFSLDELYEKFDYLTVNQINKQVTFLTKNGYIKKIDKKYFIKLIERTKLNPIKKIIAIEAKLTDYKNGLIQARRYQYFADESYLAILKKAEKNIDLKEFNRYNIGLILFDEEKCSVEIKYPKKNNTVLEYNIGLFAKELIFNKFIRPSF